MSAIEHVADGLSPWAQEMGRLTTAKLSEPEGGFIEVERNMMRTDHMGSERGIPPCVHCDAHITHLEKQEPYEAIHCSACRRVRDDLRHNKELGIVEAK